MSQTELEMNPYGMVFTGTSVTAELAMFAAKNSHGLHDILLKVTGAPAFTAGIDQITFRYQTVPAGTGQNFTFVKAGKTLTRMSTRSHWGAWQFFDLYLDGKTIPMVLDKGLSNEARPLHLLTEYNQRMSEAPSRLGSERVFATSQQKIRELGWNGDIVLNWGGHEKSVEARFTVFGVVSALPAVFVDLLRDSLGKEAMASVQKLEILIIDDSSIEMSKNTTGLILNLGAGAGADGIKETLIELISISIAEN